MPIGWSDEDNQVTEITTLGHKKVLEKTPLEFLLDNI